jgi:hypothetical protein
MAKTASVAEIADRVIFCHPPGSPGCTDPYAQGSEAFFNDGTCLSLSTGMHKFGHTIGLGHSGYGNLTSSGDFYCVDTSGMMG